ncbi:MAG: hypothetical protein H8D45_02925 [Bacteroidetes bacterium]|nr:hypothetical protein [Bacteroidota bacterium]
MGRKSKEQLEKDKIARMRVWLEKKWALERLQRQNPLRFYCPNGTMENFIKLVGEGEKLIYLDIAANKVGKTACLVNVLGNIFWGKQKFLAVEGFNWEKGWGEAPQSWFDYPLFNRWPHLKRFWIVSEPSSLRETVIPELKKWFPQDRYQTFKDGFNYEYRWEIDTGFTFYLRTYEQDPDKFESANLGGVVFDEPPPKGIFDPCVARLMSGGIVILAMTPVPKSDCGWVVDDIIDNPQKSRAFITEVDIEQNCLTHGTRGRLDHEQIQQIIANYDEDEREAREHGKFVHLSGLIYKSFKRDFHIVKSEDYPIVEDCQGWYILDPHDRKPPFMIWIAVRPDGLPILFNEFPVGDFFKMRDWQKTIEENCETIDEIEKVFPKTYKIRTRIIDVRYGGRKYQNTQRTVKQEYGKFGIKCIESYTDSKSAKSIGREKFKALLKPDNNGNPQFVIWDTCRNTIFALTHHTWDDWHGKAAERRGWKEGVESDKYADPIDLLRYWAARFNGYIRFVKEPDYEAECPTTGY